MAAYTSCFSVSSGASQLVIFGPLLMEPLSSSSAKLLSPSFLWPLAFARSCSSMKFFGSKLKAFWRVLMSSRMATPTFMISAPPRTSNRG